MGELIAFRLPKNALRPRRARWQWGTVLFFTGVRREIMGREIMGREIMGEVAPPAKRAPGGSGQDAGKGAAKPSRKDRGAAESGAPGLADSE
jgi:hypothetical protein